MDSLTGQQKKMIMDGIGKIIINKVRDPALKISMDIAKNKTKNPIKIKQYEALLNMNEFQKEAVCNLLSETVTDVIYRFMEMFEEHSEKMDWLVKFEGNEYNITTISEKLGSEIACYDESGWIQKFSKLGYFIL